MSSIQIKRVPAEIHKAALRRAESESLSLSDYLLNLVERDLSTPSLHEWFALVDTLPPVPGVDGATLIREVREELESESISHRDLPES